MLDSTCRLLPKPLHVAYIPCQEVPWGSTTVTDSKGRAKQVDLEDACSRCFDFWSKSLSGWMTWQKLCELCKSSKDFQQEVDVGILHFTGEKKKDFIAIEVSSCTQHGFKVSSHGLPCLKEKTLDNYQEAEVLRTSK